MSREGGFSGVERIVLGGLKRVIEALARDELERVAVIAGILEGGTVKAMFMYLVDNLKRSPVEFEADPWQVVQAVKSAEKYGLDIVAVFHTHTQCPASPSLSDMRGMKRWPYIWVIACKEEVRAWKLDQKGGVAEVTAVE